MEQNAALNRMPGMGGIIEGGIIERRIFIVRGRRVMLDRDLAELYGVPTKSLNLAVTRHLRRFPEDFAFRLTVKEAENLRFQSETSSWGGRRYSPRAFTEQGVAMLSGVLNSERAVSVNVEIIRVFVRLRDIVAANKELAHRLDELEKKYDARFKNVFDAIRELMDPPAKPRRVIGFRPH